MVNKETMTADISKMFEDYDKNTITTDQDAIYKQ